MSNETLLRICLLAGAVVNALAIALAANATKQGQYFSAFVMTLFPMIAMMLSGYRAGRDHD